MLKYLLKISKSCTHFPLLFSPYNDLLKNEFRKLLVLPGPFIRCEKLGLVTTFRELEALKGFSQLLEKQKKKKN